VSQGICFYINYSQPVCQLAVALSTLERNYDGDICVLTGSSVPEFFLSELRQHGRLEVKPVTTQYARKGLSRGHGCWFTKVLLHQTDNPFDATIFYDCDHVFKGRFDLAAFDMVRGAGLIGFHRSDAALSNTGMIVNMVETVCGVRYESLQKAQGGCVGSVRGSPKVVEWAEAMEKFCEYGGHPARHADEYALDYVMAKYGTAVGPSKWSHTVGKREEWGGFESDPNILAMHYPMARYAVSKLFKAEMEKAVRENFMSLSDKFDLYAQTDGVMASVSRQ
jgi:hypothetical protein